MNETEAIKKVAEKATDITSRKETKEIIVCFLNCVRQALKDGEEVRIKDIGTFIPKTTKARMGRNPQTGERIEIAAKKTVSFRPSPNFIKNILNGGEQP